MAAAVTAGQERTIALLERLVNRNSGSLNLEGVRAVGQMMREELEPLGFTVRWIDMGATGRAGHIVATHSGPGRNVLLIGHLDTVFEPDSPFRHFTRSGSRATGPGVGDDKGGVAVIVAAVRAMHAAGTLRDANITIVLTGDEARTGAPLSLSRRDLIEAGRAAAYALEFENLVTEDGRDFLDGCVLDRGEHAFRRGRSVLARGRFRACQCLEREHRRAPGTEILGREFLAHGRVQPLVDVGRIDRLRIALRVHVLE